MAESGEDKPAAIPDSNGQNSGTPDMKGIAVKAALFFGGVYLVRRLTKRTTRWDHAKTVSQALAGEKEEMERLSALPPCPIFCSFRYWYQFAKFQFSAEQAARDPMTYFNLRLDACPAATLADGARLLYYEQAFWRTPERPFRQRFYMVKPCPKEMKCDVEVASYAVKDVEQFRNFCDRSGNERPQPEDFTTELSEHLTTVYLNKCERGQKCLYQGSTPPGGFPNNWNDASRCTSEMSIHKNGEIQCWDRAYDSEDKQVWGPKSGPYEFKPWTSSRVSPYADADVTSPLKQLENKAAI